jgi:osmotically-inducible protein OsmY
MKSCLIILCLCLTALLQGCAAAVATGAAAGAAVGISAAHDRRTFGTVIDDQNIELKANAALRNDEVLHKSSHINAFSYAGTVLLTGETPSKDLKKRATELVKSIPNIKHIYNELDILAPSSLMSRSSDSWITAKIKDKMVAEKGIDSTRIKVVTERGTVYLLGLVTPKEAELAVSLATHTEGVQRVVKVFEYLNETALE